MPRGGRREPPGGRPRLIEERAEAHSVTLTPEQWEFVKQLGEGNASLGIRRLIERAVAAGGAFR